MMVARLFSKIFKEGGVILIDHTGQKYICGNPRKENPITIKLLKRDLNWKLILDPELEFPEAYMRNDLLCFCHHQFRRYSHLYILSIVYYYSNNNKQ